MRKQVKTLVQVIIIFSILLISMNLASAATYYVNINNKNCNDGNSKSKATNISTPWCGIQPAFDNVAGGDTISILTGEYDGVFLLENKDFTSNVKITAYQDSNVNITSNTASYLSSSNTFWTKVSTTGNVWKTKLASNDIAHPEVFYPDITKFKFFTWANYNNFLNSKYSENSWYDSSTKELYVKFSDSTKDPNKISLYVSARDFPFQIRGNSVSSNAYITISNLNFKYNAKGGIHINDQSNVIVENCKFIGGFTGIQVGNMKIPTHKNLIFRNNNLDGRQNPDWFGNDMKNEGTEETSAMFISDQAGRVEIYNNEFYYWHGGLLMWSTSPGELNNSEVYGNTFYHGKASQIEIEDYCSNTKYHDNKIYSDDFAGVSFAPADASAGGCQFYNNIIVAKGQQTESIDNNFDNYAIKAQSRNGKAIKNWKIYHNTFYGYGRALNTIEMGPDGVLSGAWANTVWKDNIFYAETEYALFRTGLATDGVFYDYNLYYVKPGGLDLFQRWNNNGATGYNTLADAKESSDWDGKWDIHSKQADPLFTDLSNNNLKPKTGSPACTMSSTGSYVGAIPCDSSSTNHAPTQSKPLLRASDYPDNSSFSDLYCYNQSTADVDGDKVINLYRWFLNSSYMPSFDNKTMVGIAYTHRYETWICEVTPNDGHVYGAPMNSSPLYILPPPVCGDKICNTKENCSTCSSDCGSCPVTAYCGDKTCNGKENCSTCSGDCGACPVTNTKITGCVLEDVAWNENTALKRVYNLSSCFKDPLKTTLTYSVRGNKQIKVTITSGMVDLSSPSDWSGHEHVVFYATSGNRSASTNNITLSVNHVAVCGDDVCEDNLGEDCDSCSSDCGTCPKPKPSGGGGGGGGGSFTPSTSSTTNDTSNDTVNDTAEIPSVIITDNVVPDNNPPIIPEEEPEPTQDSALTEQNSDLETSTGSGFKEPEPITGSAVAQPVDTSSSSNNNLVPIVFITLALIMAVPGVYIVSKNHSQLLAKFGRTRKVVYYEEEASEKSPPDYFDKLHEFVSLAINRGHDKLLIASKLKDAGWSGEIVESVIDTHKKEFVMKALESSGLDSKHVDELHEYVKKALQKGYSWVNIANDLLRAGWTSKVVDCLLKTYCDTSLSFLPSFNPSSIDERIA